MREDWELGRVYLPQDELAAYGVSEELIAAGRVTPEWQALLSFQATRARAYLRDGLELLSRLDGAQRRLRRHLRGPLPCDTGPHRGSWIRRVRRLAPALPADEAAHRGRGAAVAFLGRR